MHEHGVMGFSAMDGNELNARSSNVQVHLPIDCDIRLETLDVMPAKAFPEELVAEILRRVDFACQFILIIASGIRTGTGESRTRKKNGHRCGPSGHG